MAVILPFESALYQGTQLPVEFVGHPLSESLAKLALESNRDDAREQLGCAGTECIVSLYPGSRSNEIRNHLPLQLATCALLSDRHRDIRFLLAAAPTVPRQAIERIVAAADLPPKLRLDIVEGRSRQVMLASDVALAKPGTVTLELALLSRPMVVMGRVDRLTALVLRRAVRVPAYAMPNLIAGRAIVPEFLQEDARPDAMAEALAELMAGPARERQLKDLAEVRVLLSSLGAARRASEIAGEMLAESAT
jgi:lipid-A-disaccharide synthase